MANDEQYTPKWIFDRMGIEFDLDVAAPISGKTHVPSHKHYNELDDGLVQPWVGRVWMNPPYSTLSPWIRKFITHNNGIGLVCISKSLAFEELWEQADGLVFLDPRIEFQQPDGSHKKIFMPTILMAMGEDNVSAISKVGRVR
jgi:hypothetical protein